MTNRPELRDCGRSPGTPATVSERSGAKWLLLCAGVWLLAAAPAGAQPAASTPGCLPARALIYVGDRDFPPYEYLDERNQPAGFNIELIQALGRELGVAFEIRLLPWQEVRQARESGGADLFSAGYLPARAEQFDFIAPTTTVRSSLLMRPGRASYPTGATDLGGLRIAIQEGTPSIAGLDALPEAERPTIVATPSHRASIGMLASGAVDAAAGSGATLRWHATDAGLTELVEVPLNSRPYMLAARHGCAPAMEHVASAIERLKAQGVVDQIADSALAARAAPLGWRQLVPIVTVVAGLLVLGLGWNWTLRRTVTARTRALSTALTEQRRLTELIQSNEGRLEFAMDVIGEGVWEWDLATDRIHASTRWAGSFGYRPDEAPTSYDTWMSYVHPGDRERVSAAARAHIAGLSPRFEATYRVPRKGGDWLWVLDRGRVVVRDESGKPLKMVGALKDISVQLAAERALHEAKDAAEATSRAKTAFLATISHEIRTPLNAVIGAATLLEETRLDVDQRQLLLVLKRAGDGLLAIVDDVLDFTKIEAGRIELDEKPFQLQTIVRESVALIEHAARQKGIRLEMRFAPEATDWLLGDDTRVRQILLNLLSNAVKFTERGEVAVDITASVTATGLVQTHIAVKDTGIGIPAARMDRLFQPFSQVDSSTTRRFGGTGLGLAISRRLAELMGGSIEVETADGQGSTFALRVAFARTEAPPEVRAAAPSASQMPHTLRVIVAEDHPVNQLVQRRMLKQLGYQCTLVENGAELLQALEQDEYDMCLLDIQMPVMDGLEAARELRRRGMTRIRLVALTADVTTETRDACAAAGIDEYLSKPVKIEALSAALARAEASTAPASARAETHASSGVAGPSARAETHASSGVAGPSARAATHASFGAAGPSARAEEDASFGVAGLDKP